LFFIIPNALGYSRSPKQQSPRVPNHKESAKTQRSQSHSLGQIQQAEEKESIKVHAKNSNLNAFGKDRKFDYGLL